MTDLRTIRCHHAGADLAGQLAVPDTPGPHPAVMVMHNAHGLGEHMRSVAQRLAAQGYITLATDMYGDGAHFPDSASAGVAIGPLWRDADLLRARVVAWFETMRALDGVDPTRLAAIGYCFGGQCVLELARTGADLRLFASYHGLLSTSKPAAPGAIKGQVAVFTGAKDPYAPREQVEAFRAEMVAAEAHWQITEFGDAAHAFTDPDADTIPLAGLAYDPLADAVSWAATLALLGATLAPA